MKLSIFALRTSRPLMNPMHNPQARMINTTSPHGSPALTIRPMARECSKLTPKPVERSN